MGRTRIRRRSSLMADRPERQPKLYGNSPLNYRNICPASPETLCADQLDLHRWMRELKSRVSPRSREMALSCSRLFLVSPFGAGLRCGEPARSSRESSTPARPGSRGNWRVTPRACSRSSSKPVCVLSRLSVLSLISSSRMLAGSPAASRAAKTSSAKPASSSCRAAMFTTLRTF